MKMRYYLFLLLLIPVFCIRANNVQISHAWVMNANTIILDLGWENAWNMESEPGNHDAVWLFFKFSPDQKVWNHLHLHQNQDLNQNNPVFLVQGVTDQTGIFILPKTDFEFTGLHEIKISLAEPLPSENCFIKAFAIEMVYIPEVAFHLGDKMSINHFCNTNQQSEFYINSENAIENSTLVSAGDYSPAETIPFAFPKGYGGFYLMKYEISQQQYAEFLNCLNFQQQLARTQNTPASAPGTPAMATGASCRNGIVVKQTGISPNQPAQYGLNCNAQNEINMPDDGKDRAMNWMCYADLAAYLDWACLRPITEMEFEKAARGPALSMPGEFAWGTAGITDANTIVFDGTSNETSIDLIIEGSGIANHGYAGIAGPLRCGFAATSSSGKLNSGASYYGVFELSGNVWEICISACEPGNLFVANHGDGMLSETGNANVESWPDQNGEGSGFRGGAWNSGIYEPGNWRDLATSDRYYAGMAATTRHNTSGGRGGRSEK